METDEEVCDVVFSISKSTLLFFLDYPMLIPQGVKTKGVSKCENIDENREDRRATVSGGSSRKFEDAQIENVPGIGRSITAFLKLG